MAFKPYINKAAILGLLTAIFGAFYADIAILSLQAIYKNNYRIFSEGFNIYVSQEYWFYIALITLSFFLSIVKIPIKVQDNKNPPPIVYAIFLGLLLIGIYLPQIINIVIYSKLLSGDYKPLPHVFMLAEHTIFSLGALILLIMSYKESRRMTNQSFLKHLLVIGAIEIVIIAIGQFYLFQFSARFTHLTLGQFMQFGLMQEVLTLSPLLCLALSLAGFRQYIKKKQFDTEHDKTSGNFGTALFADKHVLESLNAYDCQNGPFIGKDNQGDIYLPMYNKLTLSPSGGGKTTTSSIPILLSHDGPAFVFDNKGELWAVTARYRSEVLGRTVVVIDPFNVTKNPDFMKGKDTPLLKKYCLNPFDYLPEDKRQRDRMINAFAASFVINEGGSATHFDENAKILIRGYIDYMMSLDPALRSLSMLYKLMSESIEESMQTFEQMGQLDGRAGAAANQIARVGSDERGSILSTSYRQIDWMGDSNIQDTLSCSNFDLRDFLKGNMDIFVLLPEDQVKEHNRLFRMVMSLIMSMLVQANPSDLPKKKMLFLLEELAQLGACPDVEQCIEVMRSRGVIVWTIFQTLEQIKKFSKPDLFLSVPLKQIFTNDDVPTMQWIQALGGKKTVLTKTLSSNKGDSRQKMQAFGGSVSNGEGESIQETGTDLIQINEIRELPYHEQFIFLHGVKPIRCKKVRYFEHAHFAGRFDQNPLEQR